MSSQRELVQAMIRRRVSRARKLKEDAQIKGNPRELVIRFLGEFDEKLTTCESVVEKYWLIEAECQRLLSDVQRIDSEAHIELMWFGDNIDSMRLEGVKISWGEEYRASEGIEKETVVDLTSILFG